MEKSRLVLNSTLMFVLTSILAMTLHELAHFIAAWFLDAKSVALFHNSVRHEAQTLTHQIWIASAGPLFSLLIGLGFHPLGLRQRGRGWPRMFSAYMAAFGYIGFFGYLMVAPFFTYGDTGFVLRALGLPEWAIWVAAVLGIVGLGISMFSLAPVFVGLMSSATAADRAVRGSFVMRLIFWPVFLGIASSTLLHLPAPTFLSLLAPLCSPFSLLWPFGRYLRLRLPPDEFDERESVANRTPWVWVAFFAGVVILNRLLVAGWQLN